VRVGTVGRAHGVAGEVVVEGACGWFRFDAGSTVEVAGLQRRITARAGSVERPIVRFQGTDDRDAAEILRGAPIEIPRDGIPEPEPDAYFHFDLIGCQAFQDGRSLGVVAEVEDGVAHDVLLLDSGLRVPFVEAVVPQVDIEARRIEIAPDLVLGA
jgi:16S rRNA processing protein RimM